MTELVGYSRGLDAGMLEAGYRAGRFPMGGQRTITWHRPVRRGIIPLEGFHVSRSLARVLSLGRFEATVNRDFEGVMRACAARRPTWIDERFIHAYGELHQGGKAHSVEVWVGGQLAGGVYGVSLGGAFFAESKFHRVRDMSKVALAKLVERLKDRGFLLLDVQYWTEHLGTLGAVEISAAEYETRLQEALAVERHFAD